MIRFLQTPGPIKKVVLGGILVICIIGMTVYLIPTGSGSFMGDLTGTPAQGVIAKVGDQEVSVADVQQTARQMGRQQFPKGFPSSFMPFLMQRAASDLITQKALLSEAQAMGFNVTEEELRDELQHGQFAQVLFPDGNFIGQDRYEDFIQSQFNLSVPQFEQLLKSDLLIRKLRAAVEGGVTVSDADIQKEYQRENTKVKFDYAALTLDDVMKQIHPTDAELKAFYDSHKQQYVNSIPEKRKAQYVVIDTNKLKQQVQVTPQELQQYYRQNQDQYRVPEQVNLSMILVKAPPASDQKALDAAKTKADDVLKQLKAGGNFADLAKKNSEDPDSASKGGSLGWIQRGRIPIPEIEQAAFSLPKGQISGIIRTPVGFQILRVEDHQTAHLKSLDEVKAEIEPILTSQKASQKADALANTVANQARTNGLAKAAQSNGLELVNAGPFSRTDSLPGIGTAPEVLTGLFGAKEKAPPESVQTPQGAVIYQVTQVIPPATPIFEEARARVESDYKSQTASTLLAKKVQELADKAKSEHDLKKAAKEVGAILKTSELVGPDSQVPDIGPMSGPAAVAFDMQPGQISDALNTGRAGVVLQLAQKQEPPAAELAASRDRIRETLLQQRRNEFLEIFVANLRDRMEKEGKIRINKQELERITKPTSESGE